MHLGRSGGVILYDCLHDTMSLLFQDHGVGGKAHRMNRIQTF